ncbi:MAG: hypothetical protein FJW22_01085 [Acidimicrobiia bacterium]|nr:hypothetical protein [Acidimicrobiia bacterium]
MGLRGFSHATIALLGSTQDPISEPRKTMNRSGVVLSIVCGVLAVSAGHASAQTGTWADRGYINLGWGVESGSTTIADSRTSTIYEETATVTTSSGFTSGSLFDVGAGLRVWRNLTIGVGYHQEQNDTTGTIGGSIPSPIFFNRPRTLTGSEPLGRKEAATHLSVGWAFPFSDKLDALVFGGPSLFRLTQDVISNVVQSEASVSGTNIGGVITVAERKASVTGFNVGADVTYIVWSNDNIRVGAGGFIRYSQGEASIRMLATDQPTTVGGLQFGFGGRLRF